MISVCIVNWNTKDYLRGCLASLARHPPTSESVETIVVDNASGDDSAAMVEDEFPQVRLIRSDRNLGYAEGNNVAMEAASGDLILLLNPDVVVNSRTLDTAARFARAHADAAAVSILFRNPDGTIQKSVRGFPTPEALFWETVGARRLFPRSRRFGAYFMSWFGYDTDCEVDQPMGTFLMIPRAAYEQVGQLDTAFPIFFNEVDWCCRARALGWKIYFTAAAEIVHYGGRGTGNAPKRAMILESHRSLRAFYAKHYRSSLGPVRFALIAAAITAAGYVRALFARN